MQNCLTVKELTGYIKQLVDSDMLLSNVLVSGEISNYKLHSSGHMYFSLKDEDTVLKCVMFRLNNSRMRFRPEEGMRVIVRGYISVYPAGGTYQLYAEEMQPDGTGSLYLAFEQLKKKLGDQGYFDADRKKPLPVLPKAIGVVTSPTGAVIRDILNVLGRRFDNARVIIYPSAVQGADAPAQLVKGIGYFNDRRNVDVIIIARGGGSLEDLWAFNDERLAKAIYESKLPVISAVGHETDFSISDFVADLRAPTPSAAAELVMPEKRVLKERVEFLQKRLSNALVNALKRERQRILRLSSSRSIIKPFEVVDRKRLMLDSVYRHMLLIHKSCMQTHRGRLQVLAGRLDALSPLTVLARGYAVAQGEDGSLITSVKALKTGDRIKLTLAEGKCWSRFESPIDDQDEALISSKSNSIKKLE